MRLQLGIILLVLAMLACTLTSSDENENNAPTVVTTQQVVGQNPTATFSNTTPTRNPTPIITLGATPGTTCTPRTDWPILTVQQGETLSSIAQRVNSTTTILQQANCLSNPNSITAGQQLRVPVIPPATATRACANAWFFQFRSDVQENSCPSPVDAADAVGESFEGGRVYWYKATPAYPQDLVYIIYNDGTWEVYEDTWEPGQIESDPGIVPPPNRFQPVRGIGKIWREQPGVRTKLGWAYEAETAFPGRRQIPQPPTNLSYEDLYIDHGTRNLVLRLRRANTGERTWRVAGGY